jgi:asparagine synthase (glutamine-hydrolysing)
MLLGAIGPAAHDGARLIAGWNGSQRSEVTWLGEQGAVAAVRPWSVASLDSEQRWSSDAVSGSWLALSGHVFHDAATGDRPSSIAELILARLLERGPKGIEDFDGTFAIAWYHGPSQRLSLLRDRFGTEPLFYAQTGQSVLFGSRLRDLRGTGLLPGGICAQGLAEFLTYGYIPSDATLDPAVHQLMGGEIVVAKAGRGVVERRHWYRVSFAQPPITDEAAIAEQFRTKLESAVVRRIADHRTGVFVSGGMDSSSLATLLRRHQAGTIRSYSYRCASAGFDESPYARALADALHTEHREVLYGAEDALRIEAEVGAMDAPFCNVGLELSVWLLGQAAQGQIDYAFVGDGGDEIWVSHPVYAAQRMVGRYERLPIPRLVNRALRRLAGSLPDSDRKRDLRVILKRVLPRETLPRELMHYRWKAFTAVDEMGTLLTPELAAAVAQVDPFECVRQGFEGYDGPDDGVTACVYNDYLTMVPSFSNRGRILRHFGVEVRSPMLDRDLVEFGARIPTRLKLEGVERTKRILRMAMTGVLPDVINNRKDKLGHSIPLKNWLRQDAPLGSFFDHRCSAEALHSLGIFRPEAVAELMNRHRSRKTNESHTLWAVLVLQLWLQQRDGR